MHQKIQTHPRQTAKAPQATSVEECKKQVSSAWLLLMVSEANGVAIILWSQDLFISGHAAHREDYATASLAISGQNQSGASQRGKDVHFEWTRIQKTCLSELHLNEGLRYSPNDITCIRQSCEIHWLVGGKRALPSDVASTRMDLPSWFQFFHLSNLKLCELCCGDQVSQAKCFPPGCQKRSPPQPYISKQNRRRWAADSTKPSKNHKLKASIFSRPDME